MPLSGHGRAGCCPVFTGCRYSLIQDRIVCKTNYDILLCGKAAGVDCAGNLIDVVADGGKLAANLGVFVGWPWPHFFTGDQCPKIDLHWETGNCHLLL